MISTITTSKRENLIIRLEIFLFKKPDFVMQVLKLSLSSRQHLKVAQSFGKLNWNLGDTVI